MQYLLSFLHMKSVSRSIITRCSAEDRTQLPSYSSCLRNSPISPLPCTGAVSDPLHSQNSHLKILFSSIPAFCLWNNEPKVPVRSIDQWAGVWAAINKLIYGCTIRKCNTFCPFRKWKVYPEVFFLRKTMTNKHLHLSVLHYFSIHNLIITKRFQ
jgi:hypothetical protein